MTATISTPASSRLDTALGRFTMYRLVLWVLAALAGYSLLLELLGWLTFGLPAMLAHLALCLGLTYASNRAIAAVFHVRPHSESSLITGLLLYFLFWPTQFSSGLQYLDLAGVALACVLASASKYALAWRGRHIFNPAAAGAFITGLTGLNIATWWAATPAMLWLVLPGVLLVLYRVRKLLMASVFTVVAVSIVAVELLRTGMGLGEALWQPLAQRPVLFFVGFMLTEPLTLPPRRWQQLALAAVVGLLFAIPYNLGFVANSPELALLVGNALAFTAGQRGRILLRFRGSRPLTPTTTEFSFRPGRPLRFTPGQYIELNLPHGKADHKGRRRVFSLTSPPDARELTIGVGTAEPRSTAKLSLLALNPGDELTATTVGGDFVLPRTPEVPVLLIAAGIGITPYLAQLSGPPARDRDVVLLYLARNAAELAYAEELEHSGVRVIARLADGSAPPAFMQNAGPARIDGAALKALVPDIARRRVYVSGSPASVRSLRAAARRAGARRIRVDSFSGY
ncbi:ferredoxin-NADP reductase/Na+-transporting NADH:ubiquinone oxidoreductase subunit NqrB [Arthrobacter ginsengisoli]|uniref:Ferredoxin-NADP reductase/Na+-transporting NADH:ubiquinone oxidoreductase subunit NqrB n=1 Tax=Arthrobacter ginsengisoli TaxID=1356565 RepID=A0ABU1UD08_9MICC|nr:oxidoreductase [Arthrobacter ginsengisoli]MDR7082990.1 ferredoxin-NADP reductase/Na+-transporting NADH:ubiquinone oxidoreductase subunit NqrB [Arthrobacter ginsengisoli]